ncbi:MAG: ornithine cyclodeaminase family protein [Thaumarchaeota archaeon]|nr:ornithine cyclodeaminase family protein [Nitrososphaerota archaeon]
MVLVLSREDIASVLEMDDVIDAVERAFVDFAKGKAKMPPRSIMDFPENDGWVGIMSAAIETAGSIGTKVVTVFKNNAGKSMPTTMATILLNDASTGEPLAIMEAGLITAMRTGAASAIATKYLARKDSHVVGLFGAGIQAKYQLFGVSRVRKVGNVKQYTPTKARQKKFAEEMEKEIGAKIQIVGNPKESVQNSDIVITATTSPTPVFNGKWVSDGTHINAIGAHTKDTRELDTTLIEKAKIVVDLREAALKEAGEIVIPKAEGKKLNIYAELSELVSGKKKGRTSDSEVTVYKGCGIALEDLAVAKLAYDLATKKALGKNIYLQN